MGLFDSWSVKDYKITFNGSNQASAGLYISGQLSFKTTSEMSFRSITLKIVGRENTVVGKRRGGKKGHSRTVHFRSKNTFFKVHVTLLGAVKNQGGSWSGKLASGSYCFPFCFKLPNNLLPSFSASGAHDSTASVDYYVKSKIDIPFGSDSGAQASFFISAAIPASQHAMQRPYYSLPKNVPRFCCGCCNQGFTHVSFSIDKDTVALGVDNQISGTLILNNQGSKEDIKSVNVQLDRVSHWAASNETCVSYGTIGSTTVFTDLRAEQEGEMTFPFSINLQSEGCCTFAGHLINVTYVLRVLCDDASLGDVPILVGSRIDPSNTVSPLNGTNPTCPRGEHGQYPKFLYAPPPGASQPQIPPQKEPVGPLSVQNNIQMLPYS